MCVSHSVRVQVFVTPWIVARQAPLSMGFSRHEYWSGLPFPSPGDSPGMNTGGGCHFLLQGIFLTQGSNLVLLRCKQILYCLRHQGSPKYTNSSYNLI